MESKKVFENEKGAVYELERGYFKVVFAAGIYSVMQGPLDYILKAYFQDNDPMNLVLQ